MFDDGEELVEGLNGLGDGLDIGINEFVELSRNRRYGLVYSDGVSFRGD